MRIRAQIGHVCDDRYRRVSNKITWHPALRFDAQDIDKRPGGRIEDRPVEIGFVLDVLAGIVETFATLAYGPEEYDAFANDRLLNSEQEALRTKQRRLSHALRGQRSR